MDVVTISPNFQRPHRPGSRAGRPDARWWRRAAALASGAAVCVPPPMVTQMAVPPALGQPGQEGWGWLLWIAILPMAVLLWCLYTMLWSPLIGVAIAALWGTAGAVPRRWSHERARAVLVAAGAFAFALAGGARATAVSRSASHRAVTPDEWREELRWALLPLGALGVAAGGALARTRTAPRDPDDNA